MNEVTNSKAKAIHAEDREDAILVELRDSGTVQINGVTLGAHYLMFEPDANDDQIRYCYQLLRRIGRRLGWWVGDFLVGVEQLRGSDRLKIVMEEWGVSERYAYAGLRVCRLIPRELRVPDASFEIHQAALDEAESVESAIAWVKRAVEESMNAATLRAEIRHNVRTINGQGGRRASGPRQYAPIYKATIAVQRIRIEDLPAVDRSALRADTEDLWRWLNRLHAASDAEAIEVAAGPSAGSTTRVR